MWQRGQELTSAIIDAIAPLPETPAEGIIANQVIRSSSSIAANIAEGHDRFAQGAYRNHLSIARGSTAETISWIDPLARRGSISPETKRDLFERCAELMKMITARMATMDRTGSVPKRIGDERVEYEVE